LGVDLDKSLVARLVAGVYGVSFADDDLIAGAKSPVFRGDKTKERLGSARRSASPVDGVDVAALVTDIGDSVAVLDGPGATVLRSLGGDVLALDGGSVGHGDLAGGCDLRRRNREWNGYVRSATRQVEYSQHIICQNHIKHIVDVFPL